MPPNPTEQDPIDWTTRSTPLGPPAAVPAPISPPPAGYLEAPLPYSPPRRKRTGLVIALIAAILAVAAGIATAVYFAFPNVAPAPLQRTFDANGTFTINGDCFSLGYSDIRDGTEVQVTDASGKVLAFGQLASAGACRWAFIVHDVPAGQKFYGITVSHRGAIHYSEDEMRAGVALSLG